MQVFIRVQAFSFKNQNIEPNGLVCPLKPVKLIVFIWQPPVWCGCQADTPAGRGLLDYSQAGVHHQRLLCLGSPLLYINHPTKCVTQAMFGLVAKEQVDQGEQITFQWGLVLPTRIRLGLGSALTLCSCSVQYIYTNTVLPTDGAVL